VSDDADRPANGIASLERGLQALSLLVEVEGDLVRRSRGLGVQQVANELGVHKSTASRLMRSLVAHGYAVPNPRSARGFRLGPAVQVHQALTLRERRLRELAHPFVEELAEATGECAHAAVASGARALVIDDVEPDNPLRFASGKGRHVPLHCTSAGKCLLAFGLAPIPAELPGRTARTITDADALRAHLSEIVERGFALDDEENHAGVRCMSAPFFDGHGRAIGCVGINGPAVRVSPRRVDLLAGRVIEAAQLLSATLAELAAIP
jgi:DNA-binding IclR family transcriptional regulator